MVCNADITLLHPDTGRTLRAHAFCPMELRLKSETKTVSERAHATVYLPFADNPRLTRETLSGEWYLIPERFPGETPPIRELLRDHRAHRVMAVRRYDFCAPGMRHVQLEVV